MCDVDRQQLGSSVRKARGVCVTHIPEEVGGLGVASSVGEFGAQHRGIGEAVVDFHIDLIVAVLVRTRANPVVQPVVCTRAHAQIGQGKQLHHFKGHRINDVAGPGWNRMNTGKFGIARARIGGEIVERNKILPYRAARIGVVNTGVRIPNLAIFRGAQSIGVEGAALITAQLAKVSGAL